MELEDIAIDICMEMRKTKAKERKCKSSFTNFSGGTQCVSFTAFWISDGAETNKDVTFYAFQTDEHHKESLQKVKQYLRHQINEDQLFK